MDASEIRAKRLNEKEVLTPVNGETIIFPIALSGGDQRLRTSTLIRDRPDRGEEQGSLQGESDRSSSAPLQDSSLYDGEARHDFSSISGNPIYPHHVEPRVDLYVPRQVSFLILLKYIDVTRATSTSLDVMLEENIDDYWKVDKGRKLSDTLAGFTRFTISSEKPPDGCTWSGRRLTRIQTTSRPDTLWPEILKDVSDASKRKEKRTWTIEKPKHNCVVFTSLIQLKKNSRKS